MDGQLPQPKIPPDEVYNFADVPGAAPQTPADQLGGTSNLGVSVVNPIVSTGSSISPPPNPLSVSTGSFGSDRDTALTPQNPNYNQYPRGKD